MANPNDEPIWAADRVVASTPGPAITIHATANEFAIKGNHLTLVKGNQFDAFADEGSSNSDANKIMERMDAMTMKIDAQYKEMKSRTECNHCGGLPNYGKFLKELVSNKHKVEQISSAFLSDKSLAIIQNKVPPKLGDPGSFLIPYEDFDALLDEGSKILYSIEGTPPEEKIFAEFNEFIAMNIKEITKPENDEEEITFEKITFDTDYKIKKSLEESLMNLELKPLPDHLEYAFLEEPSLLPLIISSQLSEQKKDKLISVLKRYKQAFA
ncbi:hypothetical protein Tco_1059515 [Tanacetum coccineum]